MFLVDVMHFNSQFLHMSVDDGLHPSWFLQLFMRVLTFNESVGPSLGLGFC